MALDMPYLLNTGEAGVEISWDVTSHTFLQQQLIKESK